MFQHGFGVYIVESYANFERRTIRTLLWSILFCTNVKRLYDDTFPISLQVSKG